MKAWFLLLVVSCSGCSLSFLPIRDNKSNSVSSEVASSECKAVKSIAQYPSDMLQPSRSIGQLLIDRLTMCEQDVPAKVLQDSVDEALSYQVEDWVDERQLDVLLLASCHPAKTPGLLNQLLANLTSAGTWPEEYAAFFALLISGQRAYASVEKVYLDLKEEHEKTIQGLSEIESQIDAQNLRVTP